MEKKEYIKPTIEIEHLSIDDNIMANSGVMQGIKFGDLFEESGFEDLF